jgi:hypothetical protein
VSFSEDCVRFGDELAKLVDAGVPVKDAAVAVGISPGRCYAILRATGRPVGLLLHYLLGTAKTAATSKAAKTKAAPKKPAAKKPVVKA